MIIPKNSTFRDYNLNFHRMIDIHSKYHNMNKNGLLYALIFIDNHIITCYIYYTHFMNASCFSIIYSHPSSLYKYTFSLEMSNLITSSS